MIDQIIKNVKSELASKLITLGLSATKTSAACDIAKEVIMGKLATQAAGGNMTGVMNLFTSKQPLDQSSLVQNMMSDYGAKIAGKFGVTEPVAKSVSSFMIPFIMSRISNNICIGGPEALQSLMKKNGAFGKMKFRAGQFFKVMLF